MMVKLLGILADFLSESSRINNTFWDILFLTIACFHISISFKIQIKKSDTNKEIMNYRNPEHDREKEIYTVVVHFKNNYSL